MDIYIDVLLLINLVMNSFVLWLVAKLRCRGASISRIILGGCLGSVYVLFYFLPFASILLSWPLRILVMMCMVIITFRPHTWGELIRLSSYFIVVVFATAGTVIALTNAYGPAGYLQATYMYANISFVWLIVSVVALFLVGGVAWQSISATAWKEDFHALIEVTIAGETVQLQTLVDTGNQLVDPINNKPVIIICYDALKDFVPMELKHVLCYSVLKDNSELRVLKALSDSNWIDRCRIIPFKSVGMNNGILIAFRPDNINLNYAGSYYKDIEALIGVVSKETIPDENYVGLMHPYILRQIVG